MQVVLDEHLEHFLERRCRVETCYTSRVDATHIAIVDLVRPGILTSDWTITRINVPRHCRGRGEGSKLLDAVLADADTEGAALQLEIAPSDGLTYEQLEAWYMRRGFQHKKHFMQRLPRKEEHAVPDTASADHE